jgi:aspartyl-tRNA(Asn)/glutamyl-tRNA(Gln) amidotransferase subunit B
MYQTGADPFELAAAEGPQIRDEGAIAGIIDQVIAAQNEVWTALVAGDEKKFGYFVGQIMKASQGKANPQEANRLLKERLERERNSA